MSTTQPQHGPLRHFRTALALAVLAACPAAFAQITTTFTGSGTVAPTGEVTPPGTVALQANGSYDFAGFGTWSMVSGFVFDLGTSTGLGGFQFWQGSDSFVGTVSTALAPVALGPGFEITYTITEGFGSLVGITGGASSLVRLTSDTAGPPPYAFLEAGIISVTLPAVPEPGTALLMLGGAAALWARQRRLPAR
jgi:hypothetical protein